MEVQQQPPPVALSATSAKPSRVPTPRRWPSVALGSLWPKSLTHFNTSYGSSDKDADREPAAAAVAAAGHLVYCIVYRYLYSASHGVS